MLRSPRPSFPTNRAAESVGSKKPRLRVRFFAFLGFRFRTESSKFSVCRLQLRSVPVTQTSVPNPLSRTVEARGYRVLRRWQKALSQARFRWLLLFSFGFALVAVKIVVNQLHAAEVRPGVVLSDPILAVLPVADLSIPIFVIEYGCALAVLALLAARPARFAVGILGYGIVIFWRSIAIGLAPLDPPPDLVLLVDPVAAVVGGGPQFTKDLFFSGHTAAMAMFTLTAPKRWARWVFGGFTAVIGVMLMIQRVHYAVDVLVALVMAFVAWRIARPAAALFMHPTRSKRRMRLG